MTTKPIRETKTFKAIYEAVKSWHEFTFAYEGHTYTVLGALIGIDTAYRLCLWADLVEVDGKPMQTPGGYKCFDIEWLNTPIRIGKLRGKCSYDYTEIEQAALRICAYGAPWDRKCTDDQAPSGSGKNKTEKTRSAREKLEALFDPD